MSLQAVKGKKRRSRRSRFEGYGKMERSSVLTSLGDGLGGWLASRGMDSRQLRLIRLFRLWDDILGEYLCSIARPIGHRGKILLVGCFDSCAMQELAFAVVEILERVNAFMQEKAFEKVELHMLSLKDEAQHVEITQVPHLHLAERPSNLGHLSLPEDSPVGACYAAYVRMFDRQ